ncbi:sporulation integral membrane protein YlbJ [Tumebacillus lipolyticus]|uniref:Sporulation integral membrane protein YlbJ n=1 Tax=Tumebacillus lipolyticus TaxID=1280370 RepID=A0ABW5A053_9BACL
MSTAPKRSLTTILATVVVFLTLSLVLYPQEGFKAGVDGLKLFWDVVFPSLLPFFILSELLLGIGVVHALGVLLEPLMRPLFSVPGVGAFALSMGLAAGYPMDAVITSKFRKNKLCTRIEGERMLAFTNTADPLFMFGAVAVGMFHSPQLGMLLAIAHYISAFLVGLLFKFYGVRTERRFREDDIVQETRVKGNIFKRAFGEMMRAREEDGRSFGKLLGDSVNDSMKTLLMILGFIIFFAVLFKVLTLSGIVPFLALPIEALFRMIGLDVNLVQSFVAGIFEIDIGSAMAAQTSAPLIEQVIIVSFIIAWSGLSVHAQVASVLTGTDIRMTPYMFARLLHAVLAGAFTLIFYNMGWGQSATEVFAPMLPMMAAVADPSQQHWFLSLIVLKNWLLLFGGVVVLALLFHFFKIARFVAWSSRSNRR